MKLSVEADIANAVRGMEKAAKQMPFATALALTSLAKQVQSAETKSLPSVFDRPTPFTQKAFGMTGATKSDPQAEVFAKTIQGKYLKPSENQGFQFLGGGRAIRVPIDIKTNQYGNIAKGAIAKRLPPGQKSTKGPSGFFLGVIRGVNALWQRNGPGKLKLLIAFDQPVEVKSELGFQARAGKTVRQNFATTFYDALNKALDPKK